MRDMKHTAPISIRQTVALALVVLLGALPAAAGVQVRGTQGLTMTGVDGISYENTSGLTMTGVDGLLGLSANGIRTDGLTMTGVDGLTMTGVDGASYTGPNAYTATRVNNATMMRSDGLTMTGVDGLTMTGVDGLTMTGVDGSTYHVVSIVVRKPSGLTMTGVDGLTMTGVDGLQRTSDNGLTMTGVDGLTMTGVDSVRLDSAYQVVATGADGAIFSVDPSGLTMTGVDGLTMTGVDGLTMTGVDGLTMTGVDGLTMTGVDGLTMTGVDSRSGLQSLDPELALILDALTDDSFVNAVVVYHNAVTDADISALESAGVRGGTRYLSLPMVALTATKAQLEQISRLSTVRSIYGNRTLQWNVDASREQTGLARMRQDADILRFKSNVPLEGNGIGVAVLDTGLDATHADLAARVVKNVKLADLQGAHVVGFAPPNNVENLSSTDQASGHGTFVGGVIAGTGARSGGKYKGFAPKARLVGLSAGDASLFNVLAGYDYLLTRSDLDVRVVNCSFSANTVYDANDPVNVATRMLAERGVNVVFSAGNTGPGLNSLNPYAAAPWVISVGAVDHRNRLASFSSRGEFGSQTARPTLVAPGVNIVSLRASGTALNGMQGAATGSDLKQLTAEEMSHYVTASGTSFSAPQVAAAIALMLEANPALTPNQVRAILQRTATPLPSYYRHEAGAGLLNVHAAVLEAAFPERRIGMFRGAIDFGQVRFIKDPLRVFTGTVTPGEAREIGVSVPADAVYASAQIAWGPLATTNDLGLAMHDPSGARRAESNYLNLPGLTGRRERALLHSPAQGAWNVRVWHTAGAGLTAQDFTGVFETARVEYAELKDLKSLDAETLADVRLALRNFTMWPYGKHFHPKWNVTRVDLAAAMVASGRVPQYVPATPSFQDVNDTTTMNFVESAQSLFPDAVRGGKFDPFKRASRLVAAVVLVRAAGLQAEAVSANSLPTGFSDESKIPAEWRGYAATAVRHGLLSSGGAFNPDGTYTRAEMARSLAALSGK